MSEWNYVVCWHNTQTKHPDLTYFKTKAKAQEFFDQIRQQKDRYSNVFLCQIIEGRFID